MVDFVVGFVFDLDLERVLTIKKDRPEWQAGLLNGVGGKIEGTETPSEAMVREFKEETGVDLDKWTDVATIQTRSGERVFVYASWDDDAFWAARTMESEPVKRVLINDIHGGFYPTVASLPYLIELARYIVAYQDLTVHIHIQTGEYID